MCPGTANSEPRAGPRVAFFPDTFDEVDGVANTAKNFQAFCRRRRLPMLMVCGGSENLVERNGCLTRLAFDRGPVGFPLDRHHGFDLAFWRHYGQAEEEVRRFQADIVHITGPSDVGQMGVLVVRSLKIPLAASWHTNLHEFAERRATATVRWLPELLRNHLGNAICQLCLLALLRFYRLARLLFAPNEELIELLKAGTGKPCYPMRRGVDTTLFDPRRRTRHDQRFVLGYVGRLTAEKNIRALSDLEKALEQAGLRDFRFLIVGQGAERPWLESQMRHAGFAGVLHGERLAEAYANMDLFVFPSRTDTYGNVVLEALASGVPAIVTDSGGPRFIVRSGETGFIAKDMGAFVEHATMISARPELLEQMRRSARDYALSATWDAVFESVYSRYEQWLRSWAREKRAALGLKGITRTSSNSHQAI
ncbi:MAG: glycosyltransferase [Acidobacteria bacterium]|nr:glycosyltransferase [Acidobacteriota bacterium]